MDIHICMHVYIYMCMYLYICVCVYTHKCDFRGNKKRHLGMGNYGVCDWKRNSVGLVHRESWIYTDVGWNMIYIPFGVLMYGWLGARVFILFIHQFPVEEEWSAFFFFFLVFKE